MLRLRNLLVVVRVRTDPIPDHSFTGFHADGAPVSRNPHRVDRFTGMYLFEMETAMIRIVLEFVVCLTSHPLDFRRQHAE